ncbi:methyl-accepting chemotaxis protein [Striga asiatica]|uniref:Methyl-accepting chemotaxis protein n=1 Tax=Striga asiatica TaxID=4170 RepID=A0A5A7PQ56_STRAF|nr:methyl-accepting chemotaxis protein [Striga asiatica]
MTDGWRTYEDHTYDFFSSLTKEDAGVHFRLGGVERLWTDDDFAAAFGLPNDAEDDVKMDYDVAWLAITNAKEFNRSSRESAIRNPALRYVHRMRDSECDLPCLLFGGLFSVNRRSNHIALGGLVTRIAEHLGLELRGWPAVGGVACFDLSQLELILAVKKENGTHYWMVSAEERLPLPNCSFVDLYVAANIMMQHAAFPDSDVRRELELLRARVVELEHEQQRLRDLIQDLLDERRWADPGPSQ